ncbi:transcript variant X1 [Nothobranchius furzeri]|uniref:Transcript variant X1 n=1 Tax=Nothobranchius furzeri TaxID=105023 RepID=A0A9D3BEW1_NOTFU|nr:transcript variant X1 [Nothobranchius furzeri]
MAPRDPLLSSLRGRPHSCRRVPVTELCLMRWPEPRPCVVLLSDTGTITDMLLPVCVAVVCVLNLQSGGDAVTDSNPHLPSCCELLELVLRKGLQQPVLSLVHRDYWHCFQQLPHHDTCGRLSALSLAIEQTRACRKLLSAQGRGRYFLRLALSRRTLPQFFTHLLHTPRVLEWYVPVLSILRNEEFVEPFMSLLLVLSNMEFTLNMENCRFLDESWLIPVCEVYEAVPCRQVGMVLRYLSGRVFILDFIPGSQAHADKFISPGDIIDEINGTSLRNSKNGQAGVVLSRLRGRPLSIHVLRWRAPHQTSANLEDGEPTPAARSCFPQTAEPRTKAAIVLPVS